jgi:methylthioribose-1-phosphate isomerase
VTGPHPTLKTGLAHPHPEPLSGARYSAVELMPGNRRVIVLDQRRLPTFEMYEHYTRVDEVAEAIRTMAVRGAPSIGVAAAYGMVLAAHAAPEDGAEFVQAMHAGDALLRATRPTAKNLTWALDRVQRAAMSCATEPHSARVDQLAELARKIHKTEVEACQRIGLLGAPLVKQGATILTHCNAGALATAGYGTALGVVRAAHVAQFATNGVRVMATETRPWLQGARLTAWELQRDRIPVELVTDSMVAYFMAKKAIDVVVVGADRVAKNGDVANKIGTYGIACIAAAHGIPFYVACPWSTVDLDCPTGAAIPIEERSDREVTHFTLLTGEVQVAPDGVKAKNPAFDVTPARLVKGIITEKGVLEPSALASMKP